MSKSKKEIVPMNPKTPVSIDSFITQAIKKGDVETLERILALRDKVRASEAKKAYHHAMADFQSHCPIIKKTKKVYDKNSQSVRYSYAPLESIVLQVKDIITENGFSYHFTEEKDEKFATAICTVTHIDGHSEESRFKVEIGTESYMNDTQKYGARMTFAKRYAFLNAFGILTGDEDTDANEDRDKSVPRNVKPVRATVQSAQPTQKKVDPAYQQKMYDMTLHAVANAITEKELIDLTERMATNTIIKFTDEQREQIGRTINEKIKSLHDNKDNH